MGHGTFTCSGIPETRRADESITPVSWYPRSGARAFAVSRRNRDEYAARWHSVPPHLGAVDLLRRGIPLRRRQQHRGDRLSASGREPRPGRAHLATARALEREVSLG